MNTMLCGYKDDPRQWEPKEMVEDEPEYLLTDIEKRLEWICDGWSDAMANDSFDDWRDVRMALHGAYQALNYCSKDKRHDDMAEILFLGDMAFNYGLECIAQGKYEGA